MISNICNEMVGFVRINNQAKKVSTITVGNEFLNVLKIQIPFGGNYPKARGVSGSSVEIIGLAPDESRCIIVRHMPEGERRYICGVSPREATNLYKIGWRPENKYVTHMDAQHLCLWLYCLI